MFPLINLLPEIFVLFFGVLLLVFLALLVRRAPEKKKKKYFNTHLVSSIFINHYLFITNHCYSWFFYYKLGGWFNKFCTFFTNCLNHHFHNLFTVYKIGIKKFCFLFLWVFNCIIILFCYTKFITNINFYFKHFYFHWTI